VCVCMRVSDTSIASSTCLKKQCCSVLLSVSECCRVLQHLSAAAQRVISIQVHNSIDKTVLQCVAECCRVLQWVAVCCKCVPVCRHAMCDRHRGVQCR